MTVNMNLKKKKNKSKDVHKNKIKKKSEEVHKNNKKNEEKIISFINQFFFLVGMTKYSLTISRRCLCLDDTKCKSTNIEW